MGHSDTSSPGATCPVCFGAGQITGPKSIVYAIDPNDPFNRVVRLCEECEGTGIVTAVRRAGIEAASMDKVLAIVDRELPHLAAASRLEARRQERDLGLSAPSAPTSEEATDA